MTDLQGEIEVFAEAASWVDDLVGALPDAVWHGEGLGEWDMRALVGHTSRALLTVEQYLVVPAAVEDVGSAEAYYEQVARIPVADAEAVLRRGIEAGASLGETPAAEFSAIVGRVTEQLPGTPDRLISTLAGGILLSSYLPTRTFELVVHGLDIARAAGLPLSPPEKPLRRTIDLASSLAIRSGEGSRLLLALTGRETLGPGFSVLP